MEKKNNIVGDYMSVYKSDDIKEKKIKELNEKISKEQQQIFDILLKISQSFSDENFTKEKRNKLFSKVDTLKENIKEYNEKLKEVKLSRVSKLEQEEEEKQNKTLEDENVKEEVIKNEEFVDTAQKLEEFLKETKTNIEKTEFKEVENKDEYTVSKRKRARTQLVVVEDDDSLSGKIKEFFNKLRNIIKN